VTALVREATPVSDTPGDNLRENGCGNVANLAQCGCGGVLCHHYSMGTYAMRPGRRERQEMKAARILRLACLERVRKDEANRLTWGNMRNAWNHEPIARSHSDSLHDGRKHKPSDVRLSLAGSTDRDVMASKPDVAPILPSGKVPKRQGKKVIWR